MFSCGKISPIPYPPVHKTHLLVTKLNTLSGGASFYMGMIILLFQHNLSLENQANLRVRLILGRDLYTGEYGTPIKFLVLNNPQKFDEFH